MSEDDEVVEEGRRRLESLEGDIDEARRDSEEAVHGSFHDPSEPYHESGEDDEQQDDQQAAPPG